MTNFINNKNYKTVYSIALYTIFFFVAVSIVNMVYMISFHSQYAELINKSGKQRMLSQRITLIASQSSNIEINNINKYINEFKSNHKFILEKDLSIEVLDLYYKKPHNLNENILSFILTVKKYLKENNIEDLKTILDLQNKILYSMDEVVLKIENESKNFSNLMVQIEILIFILIGILLYLVNKFIFKPMSNKIEKERHEDKKFQKKLEETVALKTKKLQESLNIINHYVFTSKTDKDGIITYVSDAFCELSGYDREELIGKTHSVIKHPHTPSCAFKKLWDTITSGKTYEGEVKNQKKNGEDFWLSSLIRPEFDDEGNISGYIAYRKDITHEKTLEKMNEKLEYMVEEQTKELKQSNELLKKLSETDTLTGIYNRKKLKENLEDAIKKSKRYDEIFSIVLLDIDYFKKVNDNHGHLMGDKVLVTVAKIISENIRDVDLLARWGGEEFVVLLYNQDINQAEFVANKLRETIEENNIEKLKITCSFGVSQYKNSDSDESLFKRVDDALYEAKETGRNKVCKA